MTTYTEIRKEIKYWKRGNIHCTERTNDEPGTCHPMNLDFKYITS